MLRKMVALTPYRSSVSSVSITYLVESSIVCVTTALALFRYFVLPTYLMLEVSAPQAAVRAAAVKTARI